MGESEKEDNKIYSYILMVLIVASLIIFFCFYKAIKLAIAVTKTAVSFISQVKTVLLVPILTLIPLVAVLIIYVLGFGYAYSTGEPIWNDKGIAKLQIDQETE